MRTHATATRIAATRRWSATRPPVPGRRSKDSSRTFGAALQRTAIRHILHGPGLQSEPTLQRTISVEGKDDTTPPHPQTNGALVVLLFNQLCRDFSWQLDGDTVKPSDADACDATAVQQGTTPTACECACHFTEAAGPHARIEINQTDDDTVKTGTNPDSFRIRLTGQAATTIRGIRGSAPSTGSPLRNVPDPAWLILGHELCGHAKTTYPLSQTSPATLFHQMSQDWSQTAVDIENRIRQEHSAAHGANLGIRIGEFEDIDGNIHAGSLVRLPRAMSLASLMQELDVPVRYTFLRCIRRDYFYPCTTIPSAEADMRQVRIVNRVTITQNGNQAVPFDCVNNSFPQGTHFNIEGVFWHRSVSGESKRDIASQWGVTVRAVNRANAVFGNGVDSIAAGQALPTGTTVVIPYKSAPGSTRYFLTPYTGPC